MALIKSCLASTSESVNVTVTATETTSFSINANINDEFYILINALHAGNISGVTITGATVLDSELVKPNSNLGTYKFKVRATSATVTASSAWTDGMTCVVIK